MDDTIENVKRNFWEIYLQEQIALLKDKTLDNGKILRTASSLEDVPEDKKFYSHKVESASSKTKQHQAKAAYTHFTAISCANTHKTQDQKIQHCWQTVPALPAHARSRADKQAEPSNKLKGHP